MKFSYKHLLVVPFLAFFYFFSFSQIYASTFTVNSIADVIDSTPGDGICETATGNNECSLRAAIMESNASSGSDTITIPPGTYVLTHVGGNENNALAGDLDIKKDVTIIGSGPDETIIDGNNTGRIFDIGSSVVSISNLKMKNGNSGSEESPSGTSGSGAVKNFGTLNLDHVILTDNLAPFYVGGAIENEGALTVTNSIITNNISGNYGGAIFGYGTLNMTNVEISRNRAGGFGGGFAGGQTGLLTNITFSSNTAGNSGGAIRKDGGDPLQLKNVTFKNNSAPSGDSIYLQGGLIELQNSIVANSGAHTNCAIDGSGDITSLGNNIDSGSTCGFASFGDLGNTDPKLGTFQNNGGFSSTYRLLVSSPAIDSGDNTSCPSYDQRGVNRPLDGNGDTVLTCDIGAFELDNHSPIAQAGGPYSVSEGDSVVLMGGGVDSDPGAQLSYAWDLDNNGTFEHSGQSATFSAASMDGPGSKTATFQVCDEYNACSTSNATINITNIAPNVGSIAAPSTVGLSAPFSGSANFTDPGIADTHTASWDWGDGITTGTVTEDNGSGSVTDTHTYTTSGTYTITLTVTDKDGGVGTSSKTITAANQVTALTPAKIWIGLKNSDDVGIKFDLLAEAYKDGSLITSGRLDSITGGSSGFNNAHLQTIPFDSFSAIDFPSGSVLSVKVYARNACTGSGKNSGTARLWYNDSAANSQLGTTTSLGSNNYFLGDSFALLTSTGSGPKKTVDISAGAKCSTFKTFGTWSKTL